MQGHRMARVRDLVRRVTSDLIRRVKDPALGDELVSITEVQVSRDLRHARLYVSAMAEPARQDEIVQALNRASGYLRRELGREVRLRRIPQLRFELDHSIEHGAQLLQLLARAARGGPRGSEP